MDYLESLGVKIGEGHCYEELVYRIVILYTLIYDDVSDFLKKYKLTPAKMNVLMIVKHQGGQDGISQMDLSQRLMVTTSNMTRVLAKLHRDGLIALGNVADDRRIKLIKITSRGSKLLDKVWPGYTQRLVDLTSGVSEERKQELCATFSQWMGSLKERGSK